MQASIVVGNPKLYPEWPTQPEVLADTKETLCDFLTDLLVSRLRIPLRVGRIQ